MPLTLGNGPYDLKQAGQGPVGSAHNLAALVPQDSAKHHTVRISFMMRRVAAESRGPNSIWERIALPTGTLIPGAFAGLLLALLLSVFEPATTRQVVESLGPVLAPLVALFCGIYVFLFYRHILGEFLLFPLRHLIHNAWDRKHRQKHEGDFLSFIELLRAEGVREGYLRLAYMRIRAEFFSDAERERLDILHASYSFLYLAGVECIVAALYYGHFGMNRITILGVVSLIGAFAVDLRQDRWECGQLLERRTELAKFIESSRIPKTKVPPR